MIRYFAIILIVVLASCDPISSREGITLPVMEFGLKVSPDTAYIKLGDTVVLKGSIPSTLTNGVKIEEGKAKMAFFYGFTEQTPITEFNFTTPKAGDDLSFISYKGGVEIVENDGMINRIYALPYGDSIQVEIAFVPLKKGTYCFQVQSLFYEGKKGKTRTAPKFEMQNVHWDLYQIPELDSLKPLLGTPDYYRSYYFAVTD